MQKIPDITIGTNINIDIRNPQVARIPEFSFPFTYPTPQSPPVTLGIGTPIIDIPGCVEYNSANKRSESLVDDDENGNVILCDGTVPSFYPIDFEPEQIKLKPPKEATVPVIPNTKNSKKDEEEDKEEEKETESNGLDPENIDINTANIICPSQEAPVIGTKVDGGKKTISGYEIQDNRCVTLYEDVTIINQVVAALPSAGAVTTTASIAVVATSSALLAKPLAEILLKVIKPTIKTLMKKLQKLLGKTPRKLTQSEIAANQYREKKGLPALKEPKKKKKKEKEKEKK